MAMKEKLINAVIDNYFGCTFKYSPLFPSTSITPPDPETIL